MDVDTWFANLEAAPVWGALAGATAIALGWLFLSRHGRLRPPEPAGVLTGGLLLGMAAGSWSWPVAIAAVTGLVFGLVWWNAPRDATPPWSQLSSLVAVWCVYVGVPDTKRTIGVVIAIGVATTVAAVVSILGYRPWRTSVIVIVAALLTVTLADSPGRESALIGGVGIVALLVLLEWGPTLPWFHVGGWVALAMSGRVAGLAPSSGTATALAGACLLAVAIARRVLEEHSAP